MYDNPTFSFPLETAKNPRTREISRCRVFHVKIIFHAEEIQSRSTSVSMGCSGADISEATRRPKVHLFPAFPMHPNRVIFRSERFPNIYSVQNNGVTGPPLGARGCRGQSDITFICQTRMPGGHPKHFFLLNPIVSEANSKNRFQYRLPQSNCTKTNQIVHTCCMNLSYYYKSVN